MLHGDGNMFFGLAWEALAWLEKNVEADMRTLETGTGASTVVFAASGAAHTAISPASEEHERILLYCEAHDIGVDAVEFVARASHEALMDAAGDEALDVVLIDGAHGYPYPALDWFYAAPRIRVGGQLLIDDAHLAPVNSLVASLRSDPAWSLDTVLGSRTASFRKIDDQAPSFAAVTSSNLSFDYLPLHKRPATWARLSLLQRPALASLIARHARRRR